MLGGGQDRGRVGQPGTLVAADHRGGQLADRCGSSPNVSLIRPQRRSRAMQSTGEKVQWMPVADTSTAVDACPPLQEVRIPGGRHRELGGKIVAPPQKEWP